MIDFHREIIVDLEAAQRDKTNLSHAISTLEEASNAVQKLISTAGGMQGNTGTAIVYKGQIIAAKLEQLMGNLKIASSAISNAVKEKIDADAEAARKNQSGEI